MASISKSYAGIRDTVMSASSCKADSGQVESFIQTALLEIWSKIDEDPYFLITETWTLDATTQTGWMADTQIDTLRAVQATYSDDEGNEVCLALYGAPIETPPICPPDDPSTCAASKTGVPTGFEIVGGEFRLVPYPDRRVSLTALGSRMVNCELYVDANDVRTWNVIDLPGEYHNILEMTVQGLAAADADNYNRATYWEQKASTALESLDRGSRNQVEPEPERPAAARFDIFRAGRVGVVEELGEIVIAGAPVIFTQTVDTNGNVVSLEEQQADPRLA